MDKQYSQLEQCLFNELLAGVEVFKKAKSKHKYNPQRFVNMLMEHHAVKTAKILLSGGDDPMGYRGFSELYLLDKTGEVPSALKYSMEAIIYDNKKYHELFTNDEINKCKTRLKKAGYYV